MVRVWFKALERAVVPHWLDIGLRRHLEDSLKGAAQGGGEREVEWVGDFGKNS